MHDKPKDTYPFYWERAKNFEWIAHIFSIILMVGGTYIYGSTVEWEKYVLRLICGYIIAFTGFLFTLLTFPPVKRTLLHILLIGILLRILVWPMQAGDDINRYRWEGKIQTYGYNPYSFAPDDAKLSILRDREWERINHKNLTAIYPPVTQLLFRAAITITSDIRIFKVLFSLFDIGCILLLYILFKHYRIKLPCLCLYAWNPLIVMSFTGHGHLDSLQTFWILLALILYHRNRWIWMFVSLAMAFLSKYWAFLIIPFFIKKHNFKAFPVFLIITISAYLVYWDPKIPYFKTFVEFARTFYHNGLLYEILIQVMSKQEVRLAGVIILGFVWLYTYIKHNDPMYNAFWVFGALILVSPAMHPWYMTTLIPFAALAQDMAWILLSGTMIFYYTIWISWGMLGIWYEPPLFFWAIYLPFLIFIGIRHQWVPPPQHR